MSTNQNFKLVCPVCENEENNTYSDGKFHCSLCGTSFNPGEYEHASRPVASNYQSSRGGVSSNKAENGEQKKFVILGIVFLFLFWPASIYFFYKAHKAGKGE